MRELPRNARSRIMCRVGIAALLLALAAPAAATDTGLIFVSNEKSNNLIVIDPKTLNRRTDRAW